MVATYCSMENCGKSTASKHQFPHPENNKELFKIWVRLTGNKRLRDENTPQKIFSNCRVCSLHFKDEDFGPNRRLKKNVIPSVNLPKPLQDNEVSNVLPMTPESSVPVASTSTADVPVSSSRETSVSCTEGYKTPRKSRQRCALLSEVTVSSVNDPTPKAKHFYKKAAKSQRKFSYSTLSQSKPKKKLNVAKKVTASLMDKIKKRFFESQVENLNRKGRRYTLEDKVLALALYKQSAAGYRCLSKMFSLPSRKTIIKLLNRIPIQPGLHEGVFSVLKSEVKQFKNPLDKYCLLMFDEISIQAHLKPNIHSGNIEGFEDFGFKTTDQIANHAQVFMLRGIKRKWKQPICYNFSSGGTKKFELASVISSIIRKCQDIGLKVVATVCDQGANNQAAINVLVNDTKENYTRRTLECCTYHFEIDGDKIIPLFDVPHLFKGIRNNLLKYDLTYVKDEENKIAKWEDIYTSYKMDPYLGSLQLMPKVTDRHVNPAKINKMKVSACTQVFSHTVAAAINVFALSGTAVDTGEEVLKLDKSASGTATLVEFLDQLFDSMNGSTFAQANARGKIYRTAVTATSPHIKFWNEALKVLKSFKFKKNGRDFSPPSLRNLIKTVENFKTLFEVLKEVGFNYMMPRTFSQDPLENYFCKIRGRRNVNPTASDFISYYKSLLVNSLTSKHSLGANCKEDNSEVFLALQRLVSQGLPEEEAASGEVFSLVPLNLLPSSKPVAVGILKYVSGYVVKKIGELPCSCKDTFLETSPADSNLFVTFKEYDKVKYVNQNFLNKIRLSSAIIKYIFNRDFHKKNIMMHTLNVLKNRISFTDCFHDNVIKTSIFKYCIRVNIFNYSKQLNNIIKGIDRRVIPRSAPKVFLAAKTIYFKNGKKQKKNHNK